MKTLIYTSVLVLFFCTLCPAQTPDIELQNYASGFTRPVDIADAGDARLFIVEQDGVIRIIDDAGNVLATPFLNIDPRVGSAGNEQGLLGLAFHPDYTNNGFFYVNYTDNSGDTRISRFNVTANPNVADPNSELLIYSFSQDFSNHNGGDLNFGPNDGFLYIGTGDGGSGGDPNDRSQNPLNSLGKMIRIDVDNPSGGNNYGIPASNPFVGDASILDEIWALGLRNPWRFSFDRLTGDMFIGDVGQGALEEIDFQPAESKGGENYGWRCYEGNNVFNSSGCGTIGNYTFPIHEYVSNFPDGCSITGGYVYRGTTYPNMVGKYFYVDYCAGNFWFLEPNGMGGWTNTFLVNLTNFEYSSFGEDQNGELYVAGLSSGIIYRMVDNSVLPILLSEFTVEVVRNMEVLLAWTTESEINGAWVDIEHSVDGFHFTQIGRVETKGDPNFNTYSFTDQNPLKGTSFYRLKLVDIDGQFSYSSVLSVEIDDDEDSVLSVYPNPVKSGSSLGLYSGNILKSGSEFQIFSSTGQLLLGQKINESTINLPSNVPAGLYFILVTDGSHSWSSKFMVVD